jgi:hypothetical protein
LIALFPAIVVVESNLPPQKLLFLIEIPAMFLAPGMFKQSKAIVFVTDAALVP